MRACQALAWNLDSTDHITRLRTHHNVMRYGLADGMHYAVKVHVPVLLLTTWDMVFSG